jgi:hypothetical protein
MTISKLQGTLVFVQIETPKACYEKEKGKEWKSSIVVDEDTADKWDEAFPKQPATAIKTSDFEGTYKIPAPFPDQRKQHVITLRKNTHLASGSDERGDPVPEKYRPRVLHKQGNTLVDVTASVLPANGSMGFMSVDAYESPKWGNIARLKNVMVTDMIEYEPRDSGEPGSEFDEDDTTESPKSTTKSSKAETKSVSKTKSKAKDEDDSPF